VYPRVLRGSGRRLLSSPGCDDGQAPLVIQQDPAAPRQHRLDARVDDGDSAEDVPPLHRPGRIRVTARMAGAATQRQLRRKVPALAPPDTMHNLPRCGAAGDALATVTRHD